MAQVVEAKATSSSLACSIPGDSFPKEYEPYIEEPEQKVDKKPITDTPSKMKLKLQDIQDAHNRIKKYVVFTPIVEAKHIGKSFCNVSFKCENLQNTGSFKARGACNVLSVMSASDKSKGCTVSGGRNFVSAMTYYGFRESVPINVIVPKDCPLVDKHRYKENFAIVKVHGNDRNDASLHALSYCDEIGSTYIHGSDRLDLIAGYGTLGLELLTQLENMDAILCPVGSGGLVAGLLLVVKSLKPNCLIYITVDESWISRAMINILEREKLVVEGAAACPVAAVMAGKVPELRGKNIVCVLSGGNINSSRMSRVIDRGMAAEGRLVKFSVTLPDVPGAMAKLLAKVMDIGADVKSFVPERAWMRRDIFTISVNMLIETSDLHHAKDLEKKLMKDYPHSHFIML